jgi:hypothetical protein
VIAWLTYRAWLLLATVARWRLDSRLFELAQLEEQGITCGSFVCQLRAEARSLTQQWIDAEVHASLAALRLQITRGARS